jgi:hypothetical protein
LSQEVNEIDPSLILSDHARRIVETATVAEPAPGAIVGGVTGLPVLPRLPQLEKSTDAAGILQSASNLIQQRGVERDKPGGERSMARCVAAFNATTGHELTEEDGWLFMVYLKHARMRGGRFQPDDYKDAVAYEGLMAECAFKRAADKPAVG